MTESHGLQTADNQSDGSQLLEELSAARARVAELEARLAVTQCEVTGLLQDDQALLAEAIEALQDGFVIYNAERRLVLFNELLSKVGDGGFRRRVRLAFLRR